MTIANSIGTLRERLSVSPGWLKRFYWIPFVIGILSSLVWLWLGNGPSLSITAPIVAVDIDQERANTMLPVPRDSLRIQQSFYPRWNGLREVELILARIGEPTIDENGRLLIELLDDSGTVVAELDRETRTLAHNQTLTLRFPPQNHSAGRRYVLQMSGTGDFAVSAWGYDLDVYSGGGVTIIDGALTPVTGEASNSQTSAKELRFVTRYQLSWADAISVLGSTLYWEGALILLTLLVIPLPGILILLAYQARGGQKRWGLFAWWGTAFALGLAGWPLLWQLFTLVGGRWRGWSLWVLVIVGWLVAIALWIRTRRTGRSQRVRWTRQHTLLLLLLLLGLAVRLVAVRDLIFPPWVDSSRHALITAVMAENGQMPNGYAPYLPVERSPYHYGFHALSATLFLLSEWPIYRLLLFLGQLLNALVPLTVYAAARLLTKRRGVGLLAAFLVALPFFFPGYYTTWGRMTQLAAMLLLPILLALTWLLVRGGRAWRRTWWLAAILVAGLFLIHFRVFLFYLPFAGIVWLVSLGRNGRWLAASAGLSLLLVVSRIVQLAAMTDPAAILSNRIPDYNAFPDGYVKAGWERLFIGVAAIGLLLVIAAVLLKRRWSFLPLTLAGWVGLLFILLAGKRLGLPETSLVNLNSMYITLFLPLSIFLAIVCSRVWRWLRQTHWLSKSLSELVAGIALTLLLLFGIREQIAILNPQTILAKWEDLVALDWAQANLPDDAKVAVNAWKWLGSTWTGTDGGAWLVPLAGRLSTTPPVDHIYDAELFASIRAFNEAATARDDWGSAEAAEWLRQQGVSHVFAGARGGFFDPATLARNPAMRTVYGRNGVFIFALVP